MPVALAADARQNCRAFADPQCQKMADLRARQAPLLPVAHAHPAAQPFVQFRNRPVILRDAEVAEPTTQILPELLEPVVHRDSPTPPRQFPEAMLEVREGGIRPPQLAPLEGETEEHAVVDLRHLALLLVDRQFELPVEVRGQTGFDTLARPFALDLSS